MCALRSIEQHIGSVRAFTEQHQHGGPPRLWRRICRAREQARRVDVVDGGQQRSQPVGHVTHTATPR